MTTRTLAQSLRDTAWSAGVEEGKRIHIDVSRPKKGRADTPMRDDDTMRGVTHAEHGYKLAFHLSIHGLSFDE